MADFIDVVSVDEFETRALASFDVAAERIAIAQVDGEYYAFDDTCTHLGCSLAEGRLEGETVTCRCHGSQFDVTNGSVLRGPAQKPVKSYRTRVQGGELQVEL
jgi:nitrite reductase/ring-hydroxylating ferredoxin subunit